jgi:hypothetical protein
VCLGAANNLFGFPIAAAGIEVFSSLFILVHFSMSG